VDQLVELAVYERPEALAADVNQLEPCPSVRRRDEPLAEDGPHHHDRWETEPDCPDQRLDVRKAVAALSEPEREALLLHYWADMTHEQIATSLNAPLGTIKLRVFRAREKLRCTSRLRG
jgi:RNA polymerase sigma factor (sigma-70 family)